MAATKGLSASGYVTHLVESACVSSAGADLAAKKEVEAALKEILSRKREAVRPTSQMLEPAPSGQQH
jgi:hypothetical protein